MVAILQTDRGLYAVALTIELRDHGRGYVQNAASSGYAIYVQEEQLPNTDLPPTYTTATLPYEITITPPGSGIKTVYVIVRSRNSYGVQSQNLYPEIFKVDSSGNLVRNDVPAPVQSLVNPVAEGTLRILSHYPTVDLDRDPADFWRAWVDTVELDPGVDPFTAEWAVTGDSTMKDVSSLTPGHYFVVIGLYRSIDGALSETVTIEVDLPDVPAEPDPVLSGYQVP